MNWNPIETTHPADLARGSIWHTSCLCLARGAIPLAMHCYFSEKWLKIAEKQWKTAVFSLKSPIFGQNWSKLSRNCQVFWETVKFFSETVNFFCNHPRNCKVFRSTSCSRCIRPAYRLLPPAYALLSLAYLLLGPWKYAKNSRKWPKKAVFHAFLADFSDFSPILSRNC